MCEDGEEMEDPGRGHKVPLTLKTSRTARE
jgi:hypothetical protein